MTCILVLPGALHAEQLAGNSKTSGISFNDSSRGNKKIKENKTSVLLSKKVLQK